ncbi:MAG: hypothetical protein CME07_00715 [Gemmatimonadetes bacterium]|nr:hypothetical protein [Gemmatimonadota bacterium]
MIDILRKTIADRWERMNLPGNPTLDLSFLLSGGVGGRHGKVLLFAFRRGDPRPLLLVKMPRVKTAHRWVEHEYSFLEELAEAAPTGVGHLFPEALFRVTDGARLATAQSILPGVPMDRLPTPGSPGAPSSEDLLDLARRWLARFWRATTFPEGNERALWPPVTDAVERFPRERDHLPAPVLDGAEEVLAGIHARKEKTSPVAIGHGDFLASNLILHGASAGAVDWEFGAKRQLPWVDPVHFAVDHCLRHGMQTGRGRLGGFREGFLERSALSHRIRDFLWECATEGGVPHEVLPIALPAYIMASTVRMETFFSRDYPVTREWEAIAAECLLPDSIALLHQTLGIS